VEVVASLSQGRTAAAQCGLFTYKSVPVIFEPPCMLLMRGLRFKYLHFVTYSIIQSRICKPPTGIWILYFYYFILSLDTDNFIALKLYTGGLRIS